MQLVEVTMRYTGDAVAPTGRRETLLRLGEKVRMLVAKACSSRNHTVPTADVIWEAIEYADGHLVRYPIMFLIRLPDPRNTEDVTLYLNAKDLKTKLLAQLGSMSEFIELDACDPLIQVPSDNDGRVKYF